MASGYMKKRKLAKFNASRHEKKEKTDGDEREKVASGKMKSSNKKEGKRELLYDKAS